MRIVLVGTFKPTGGRERALLLKGTLMIWFIISIVLLLFSAVITGVALSNADQLVVVPDGADTLVQTK